MNDTRTRRARTHVHLASDTNRWGACGRGRDMTVTTDPTAVTCGLCKQRNDSTETDRSDS